jgi:hypothetical protein
VIRCRGLKFRDEDDAYEYFKQRELDEANDSSIPEVPPIPQSQELARVAPRVPGEASEAGPRAGMSPGDHVMAAEKYHADPCVVPSLSSSIAKVLLRESPRKAWFKHSRLNPDYREEYDGKFDLGTTAHAVLLENDSSKVAVIDPAQHPSKNGSIPDGWTNNAIRQARDSARAAGKTPILQRHFADVTAMVMEAEAFILKSEIAEYWRDAQSEMTGIALEEGVWLRCRFDKITRSRRFIFDYKSTTDAAPEPFSRLLIRMGYHIQEAFYRRVVRNLGNTGPRFVFIAQSCEPPYECSLHGCHTTLQEIADAQVERAIQLWRECLAKKQWPSHGGRIHWTTPPTYMLQEHELRMAA